MVGRALWSAVASAVRGWEARRIMERARKARAGNGVGAATDVLLLGVRSHPREARLWNNLSALQIEQQEFAQAERSIRRAIELQPDLAEAHSNLGIVEAEQGRAESALESFGRAVQLDPGLTAARESRAALLSKLLRTDEAIAAWRELIRLDDRHARAQAALGGVLLKEGRLDEAREHLQRAHALDPSDPHVVLHLALIEAERGDVAQADRAIECVRGRIEDAEIDWSRALIRLSGGDFAMGWPLYEARLRKSFESPRRTYPFPEWRGESMAPGGLLVMAEQGVGDEIMFASCYSDLLERAPRCVIECDPRLAGLFERSFPGAQIVGAPRDNDRRWLDRYPQLSRQIHAGSLPGFFRTSAGSFPKHDGYLRPDARRVEAWRRRLSMGGFLKIGIAWRGGLVQTRRALRSVPLVDLARLLRDTGHSFVSLQYDDDGADAWQLSALSGVDVQVFQDALSDLDEMAALMRALDLVITVCSSAAHLAGAVGVRAWVLTPLVAEWRYLRAGETLPWYPSVRLFRQSASGTWTPVLDSIADALRVIGT